MGFGKDGKGVILREVASITLGTLASEAAIKSTSNIALQEDFRLIKTEFLAVATGMTSGEQIMIGIADRELSAAELAQSIVVNGPVDRNDHVANEQAHRPSWLLATFTEGGVGSDADVLNGGLPVEKTLRWTFSDTEGFNFFGFNPTSATLTTGAVIRIIAKHFGVWVT